MKNILLAIPTNKYIEPETMKSLWDMEVPEGYKVHFEFFYGYQSSQINNLIADWAQRYDYLFLISPNSIIPENLLKNILKLEIDIVSVSPDGNCPTTELCFFSKRAFTTSNYPWFFDDDEEQQFFERCRKRGLSIVTVRYSNNGSVNCSKIF